MTLSKYMMPHHASYCKFKTKKCLVDSKTRTRTRKWESYLMMIMLFLDMKTWICVFIIFETNMYSLLKTCCSWMNRCHFGLLLLLLLPAKTTTIRIKTTSQRCWPSFYIWLEPANKTNTRSNLLIEEVY